MIKPKGCVVIGEVAGKMFDITEAGVGRATSTCMKLGAWAIPFCYRRECSRIIGAAWHETEERAEEESIVRSIGFMALRARKGQIPVHTEEIQAIAEAIGPTLHDDIGYEQVFDPHTAKVLGKLAPLHEEIE